MDTLLSANAGIVCPVWSPRAQETLSLQRNDIVGQGQVRYCKGYETFYMYSDLSQTNVTDYCKCSGI
jgi:hypothetical protein